MLFLRISGIGQRLSGSALAVVLEGHWARREHKYGGISEDIWDRSAVVRERAGGCPGRQLICSSSKAVVRLNF